MKKVLLLGDSIRMGYQEEVRGLLQGKAEVVYPQENGRFSFYTLWGVNLWIKELGVPDIVHWNNGLWDLHHEVPMVEALTPLPLYIQNLSRILNELQRYGSKVIFATTIPVLPDVIGRSNSEIELYNHAAVELMESNGAFINDLYALLRPQIKQVVCEDRLHLTEEGYKICAGQVAENICKLL